MSLTGGARREIERIGTRRFPAAEGQGPQSVDHQWLAMGAFQFIDETAVLVEYVDLAVTEVADEDVAAESAEGIRRTRDTPRRIERPATDQPPQQMAVGIEHIDKAVTLACHVVVLVSVLLCISDEEIAIDVRDAEGRVAWRDPRILETAVGGCRRDEPVGSRGAEHVDRAVTLACHVVVLVSVLLCISDEENADKH